MRLNGMITLVLWIVANLIYIYLRSIHGREGLDVIRRYSPTTVFFSLIVFPVACFATLESLRYLYSHLQLLPTDAGPREWAYNWPLVTLWAILLASLIGIIDYSQSVRGFALLSKDYSVLGFESAELLHAEISKAELDEQAIDRKNKYEGSKIRDKIILEAEESSKLLFDKLSSNQVDKLRILKDNKSYSRATVLQVLWNGTYQRKLGILDFTANALNVLQLFIIFVIGIHLALATIVFIWCLSFYSTYSSPQFSASLVTIFCGLCLFLLYPVVYALQRRELVYLMGEGKGGPVDLLIAFILWGLLFAFVVFLVFDRVADYPGIKIKDIYQASVVIGAPISIIVLRIKGHLLLQQAIGVHSTQFFSSLLIVVALCFLVALAYFPSKIAGSNFVSNIAIESQYKASQEAVNQEDQPVTSMPPPETSR